MPLALGTSQMFSLRYIFQPNMPSMFQRLAVYSGSNDFKKIERGMSSYVRTQAFIYKPQF